MKNEFNPSFPTESQRHELAINLDKKKELSEEETEEQEYVKNWMKKEGIEFRKENYVVWNGKFCIISIKDDFFTVIDSLEGGGSTFGDARLLRQELEARNLRKATKKEMLDYYNNAKDYYQIEILSETGELRMLDGYPYVEDKKDSINKKIDSLEKKLERVKERT